MIATFLLLLPLQTAAPASDAESQWLATVAASRLSGEDAGPVASFRLHANVLTRQGVQSNEGNVEMTFHAPDLIRFALPDGKEVGRSGLKQRDYWLKSSDRIVALEGREYEEDRRQIQTMHAVARNFIALSDPSRLEVTDVKWLEGPPSELTDGLKRGARKLRWLRLRSPDFALHGAEPPSVSNPQALFTIDFGLARRGEDEHLPLMAIVRDARRRGKSATPMLIRLGNYQPLDGFRVPAKLEVFALENTLPYRFKQKADQEIYLLEDSSLRPTLSPEDFRPE